MIARELVVIEVEEAGIVLMTDVHNRDAWVRHVIPGGVSTLDGDRVCREECGTSEKFVFVGTPWVRDDGSNWHSPSGEGDGTRGKCETHFFGHLGRM